MGRRKGADTIAARRRRMPYVAKMRREDPFKPGGTLETSKPPVGGLRQRASSWSWLAGREKERGLPRLSPFTTWSKARAMRHWIDRSGIANRPMPKLGLTSEEHSRSQAAARSAVIETTY